MVYMKKICDDLRDLGFHQTEYIHLSIECDIQNLNLIIPKKITNIARMFKNIRKKNLKG